MLPELSATYTRPIAGRAVARRRAAPAVPHASVSRAPETRQKGSSSARLPSTVPATPTAAPRTKTTSRSTRTRDHLHERDDGDEHLTGDEHAAGARPCSRADTAPARRRRR